VRKKAVVQSITCTQCCVYHTKFWRRENDYNTTNHLFCVYDFPHSITNVEMKVNPECEALRAIYLTFTFLHGQAGGSVAQTGGVCMVCQADPWYRNC